MSRFIEVGNQLINVDKIIRVIKANSSASIILEDSQCVDIDRRTIMNLEGLYEEIKGDSHIVNVIQPTETLYAVYEAEYDKVAHENVEYEAKEVKLLAVLGNGCIEPIELLNGRYEFCSISSYYIGMYNKKQIEKEFRCVEFI